MYRIRKKGYILAKSVNDGREQKIPPIIYESEKWNIWRSVLTAGTCYYCSSMNGRILNVDDILMLAIPVHPNCRCYIERLKAIQAGTATNAGMNGVDLYVMLNNRLPGNYVTRDVAEAAGWKRRKGNLAEVLPGKQIGGNIYKNRDHRLPEAAYRVWYEADFDYVSGYRNDYRLLFSNDGLVFVTYDHYTTFFEIGVANII